MEKGGDLRAQCRSLKTATPQQAAPACSGGLDWPAYLRAHLPFHPGHCNAGWEAGEGPTADSRSAWTRGWKPCFPGRISSGPLPSTSHCSWQRLWGWPPEAKPRSATAPSVTLAELVTLAEPPLLICKMTVFCPAPSSSHLCRCS